MTGPGEEQCFSIDEVWVVPCGFRPDKPHISHPRKRLEMIRLAVADFFPKDFPVKVDTVEIENGNSIPTAFLMDAYRKREPQTDFWFTCGTDLISGLHWWDDGQRFINEEQFLIFERNGYPQNDLLEHENWPKNYKIAYQQHRGHENLLGGISSTEVRLRVKNGIGISGLVTPNVIEFINKEQLYKSP